MSNHEKMEFPVNSIIIITIFMDLLSLFYNNIILYSLG